MLRESAQAQNQPVNTLAVTKPTLDPMLPLGKELIAFVDAISLVDFHELPLARQNLLDAAGPGAVLRAAAVCEWMQYSQLLVTETAMAMSSLVRGSRWPGPMTSFMCSGRIGRRSVST